MIEILTIAVLGLAVAILLAFVYLDNFIDSYHRTMKNSLEMHQLAMDNIKALNKEIEQLKKEK
jgi:uncharacterized protein YoxC